MGDLWHAPLGLRIPGLTPRAWYFVARKTDLVRPDEDSKRSTYDVVLTPDVQEPEGFCVTKRVPSVEGVLRRINARFPNLDPIAAKQRARKLVGDVFPLFLTRETKALELLQKRLPEHLRCRVPRPLRIGRDKRGLVTRLDMNWLRNGRATPLTQAEFAASAMELLAALHDDAKIMHLDLRLDNMVITEDGVGFVDFGTSAQIDEDLTNRPVLNRLFMELMQTSEVQKVLSDMLARGEVTSASLKDVAGKPDRGMDIFYLAVQINHPHFNPELARLITYEAMSGEARTLHALSAAVLRPKKPRHVAVQERPRPAARHQAGGAAQRRLTPGGPPRGREAGDRGRRRPRFSPYFAPCGGRTRPDGPCRPPPPRIQTDSGGRRPPVGGDRYSFAMPASSSSTPPPTPPSTQNLNVTSLDPLISPGDLELRLPLTPASRQTVLAGRQAVEAVLRGDDPRLLVVVGPCSIHDPAAALVYAERLAELSAQVNDRLLVVMRVYFEKPRTTVGWKGLINDPFLYSDKVFDMNTRAANSPAEAAAGDRRARPAGGHGVPRPFHPAVPRRPGELGGDRGPDDREPDAPADGQRAVDAGGIQERDHRRPAGRAGRDEERDGGPPLRRHRRGGPGGGGPHPRQRLRARDPPRRFTRRPTTPPRTSPPPRTGSRRRG